MHWANTRLGSLLAALVADELGLFVPDADELDDPVDPHALRAAARVMAMTARVRVCARFFIENSLRTTVGLWFSLPRYIRDHKPERYLKTIRERAKNFIRQP